MGKTFKFLGIITLAVIIGFGMISCGGDDEGSSSSSGGSGKYSGNDVLGNTYLLSVGSDARAAIKGDSFKLNVSTTRGPTYTVNGKVTNIAADGTLTLKDSVTNAEFTARVDGTTTLDAVFNNSPDNGFVPRTFDKIFMKATRWGDPNTPGGWSGENWGSGNSVLVKDFPANVSRIIDDPERYTITISGTSDTKIEHFRIEVQGLTNDNEWVYLAGSAGADDKVINANTPFNVTLPLSYFYDDSVSNNFRDYKEIILQLTNVIKLSQEGNLESVEDYGTIPANVSQGQIMATISNFNIELKDTQRPAVTGMGNYVYGIQEDGLSIDYRLAVWTLTAAEVTKAKQNGTKFEITFADASSFEEDSAAISFVWQDPVRGLWWQDQADLFGFVDTPPGSNNWVFTVGDGVEWDKDEGKLSVTISDVVGDQFADSTQLNFIIACWYFVDEDFYTIDDLAITGANIVTE